MRVTLFAGCDCPLLSGGWRLCTRLIRAGLRRVPLLMRTMPVLRARQQQLCKGPRQWKQPLPLPLPPLRLLRPPPRQRPPIWTS
jgi:hypothetical protein